MTAAALGARLDTGASDCLFDRSYADILGLFGAGLERSYRTVTGSFQAFGHEVTIETLGLRWSALVFFHAMGIRPIRLLGAGAGWITSGWESYIASGDCFSDRVEAQERQTRYRRKISRT